MRNISIDILKIILAIFVVLLHLNILKEEYPLTNFILVNGIFRIAVPVFLVISGYYFFNIDNIEKFKKWSIRLLVLYGVWMLIYSPFWIKSLDITQILKSIIFGHVHLWYLIGTFYAGIILYTLRRLSSLKLIILATSLYLIGFYIQTTANINFFSKPIDEIISSFYVYRNFLFFCFPFLAFGLLIKRHSLDIKCKPNIFIAILSLVFVFLESGYIFYYRNGYTLDLLISMLLCAPILFLYVSKIQTLGSSKHLSNLSTAIYLNHIFLIVIFNKLGSNNWTSIVEILAILVMSNVIGLLLVWLNKKIKFLL